jgi:Sec-independent protein translocase protein TatA
MNFNLLGVGLPQLLIVFTVMLMLFGPKKMIEWAYLAGRMMSKMRAMFQQTMTEFQKEVQASGLDVPDLTRDLPRVPSSFNIVDEASKFINSTPNGTPNDANPSQPTQAPTAPAQPPSENPDNAKYSDWVAK